MTKHFLRLLTLSTVLSVSYGVQAGGPKSEIFEHQDKENAKNLSVSFAGETATGTKWRARSVTKEDSPFIEDLFANEVVMQNFAGGVPKAREDTRENRMNKMWLPRFQDGKPHGGLVVEVDGKPIGHFVSGGGDEAGVSEVAYSYLPECWKQKLGVSVLTEVVETWAPTVRRIGLGKDPVHNNQNVIAAFCCFGGADKTQEEKILRRQDATASPKNPGSWIILDRTGFEAAQYKLDTESETLNFRALKIPVDEVDGKVCVDYKPLEEQLVPLFDVRVKGSRDPEKRHSLIDPQGIVRTVSLKFGVVKYHFERPVVLAEEK